MHYRYKLIQSNDPGLTISNHGKTSPIERGKRTMLLYAEIHRQLTLNSDLLMKEAVQRAVKVINKPAPVERKKTSKAWRMTEGERKFIIENYVPNQKDDHRKNRSLEMIMRATGRSEGYIYNIINAERRKNKESTENC